MLPRKQPKWSNCFIMVKLVHRTSPFLWFWGRVPGPLEREILPRKLPNWGICQDFKSIFFISVFINFSGTVVHIPGNMNINALVFPTAILSMDVMLPSFKKKTRGP